MTLPPTTRSTFLLLLSRTQMCGTMESPRISPSQAHFVSNKKHGAANSPSFSSETTSSQAQSQKGETTTAGELTDHSDTLLAAKAIGRMLSPKEQRTFAKKAPAAETLAGFTTQGT